MPASAQVACVKIGGQLATNKVAEVLDPVDVGNSRGDQMAGHIGSFYRFGALISDRQEQLPYGGCDFLTVFAAAAQKATD